MNIAIHSTHNLRLTLALSCLSTALAGASAYSADASTGDTDRNQLEEIVVTAQKREQNVQETPLSITLIGLPTDTLRAQQFDADNNFGGPEGVTIVNGNSPMSRRRG